MPMAIIKELRAKAQGEAKLVRYAAAPTYTLRRLLYAYERCFVITRLSSVRKDFIDANTGLEGFSC
jgi:hypothetical protein